MNCPKCGSSLVRQQKEEDSFPYGDIRGVVLTAVITVRTCEHCGFKFTGPDADLARDRAIGDYLERG